MSTRNASQKSVVCKMMQCKPIIRIQSISQCEKINPTIQIHPQSNLKGYVGTPSGNSSLMGDPLTKGSCKSSGDS